MATVHFVKSARKDNPVAKVGESYYWWRFAFGSKRYSKTPPRRSQLTQSEFLGWLYDMQDRIASLGGYETAEDLASELEEIISEIRDTADEQYEKRENMPEQFQDSSSGQLLEERSDGCHQWADDLEGIDLDFEEESDVEFSEWLEEKIMEIQSMDPGL